MNLQKNPVPQYLFSVLKLAHLRAYLPAVIGSENSSSILGRVWQPALFTANTSGLYNPSTVQVSCCVHCSAAGYLYPQPGYVSHTALIQLHSRCFTTVLKRFLRLHRKYLPSESLSSRIISGNEVRDNWREGETAKLESWAFLKSKTKNTVLHWRCL